MDTLRMFSDGDPASRRKTDLGAEDSRSSEDSGPVTRPRKGRGKNPERQLWPAERHTHNCAPFVTCSDGGDETGSIARSPQAARWVCPVPVAEEPTILLRVRVREGSSPPYRSSKNTPGGETWTGMTTWDSAQTPTPPEVEDPPMAGRLDTPAEDRLESCQDEDHLVDPQTQVPQTEVPLEDHQEETPQTNCRKWTSPRTSGDGSSTSRGRSGTWSARRRSTRSRSATAPLSPPRPRRSWTSLSSRWEAEQRGLRFEV